MAESKIQRLQNLKPISKEAKCFKSYKNEDKEHDIAATSL